MRSIREVCARNHTPEEIIGWGNRTFDSEMWKRVIQDDFVWFIDSEGQIEGYGHLRIYQPEVDIVHASIRGLYLVPEALGQGLGNRLIKMMLIMAGENKASEIFLASTLTAHTFYKKMGFVDSGPQGRISIGGSDVTYIPMRLEASTK